MAKAKATPKATAKAKGKVAMTAAKTTRAAPGRRQGRSQDTLQVEEGAADRSGFMVVRKFGHSVSPEAPSRLFSQPSRAGGTAGTPGAETPWTGKEKIDIVKAARARGKELQLGQLFVANGGDVR